MEGRTVLVLEDEAPLQKAIKNKLESHGCQVVTARTVKQGLDYLDELEHIDVIWLDHYLLGKEDGLDFVSAVKSKDSKFKQIPIFVVSNTATQDKITSYIRLGVEKYFTKADNRLDDIISVIKDSLSE